MEIHKISIRNIMGVESLDFTPANITRITGGNGAGKTSVLEALKAVCKGGHDATLLRAGQQKGEIVLDFADGLQISKRITEKGSYLSVTKDGAPVGKPAEFLKNLWDSLSANPIEFMLADKRKRIDWLLEQIDPAPVIEKLQAISPGLGDLSDSNALAAMDSARKTLFEARTEINRTAKRASERAEILAVDLPKESGDVATELIAARQQHARAAADLDEALVALRDRHEKAIDKLQEQKDEAVAQLQRQIDEVKESCVKLCGEQIEATTAAGSEIRANLEPHIQAAAAEVSRLTEAQRVADEAAGRRKLLDEERREAAEATEKSRVLSDRIAQVDELKADVLETLPIPGVEIIDGDIHKDGVPFARLNTATQWAIAIGIAKSRAGEIPLICADGLEALDDENFKAFSAMAAQSGLHFVVTDRGNGPLAVDTDGKREAAA